MNKKLLPLLLLFAFVTVTALLLWSLLQGWGVSPIVLLAGNAILFLATGISFYLNQRALQAQRTQAFITGVYGGFIAKLVIILVAVVLYLTLADPINKPALFICMGLYLLYSFLGTTQVVKKPTADAN